MDHVILEVYVNLVQTLQCTVDDILESPEYREAYLSQTRQHLGQLSERTLLHRLTSLRKSGKLPKTRELIETDSF